VPSDNAPTSSKHAQDGRLQHTSPLSFACVHVTLFKHIHYKCTTSFCTAPFGKPCRVSSYPCACAVEEDMGSHGFSN
jgi:hypothetical protein